MTPAILNSQVIKIDFNKKMVKFDMVWVLPVTEHFTKV